jgi:hypothetical protein
MVIQADSGVLECWDLRQTNTGTFHRIYRTKHDIGATSRNAPTFCHQFHILSTVYLKWSRGTRDMAYPINEYERMAPFLSQLQYPQL